MKKLSLKMVALMAAVMMCLTTEANRWSSEDRAMLASDMSSRDRGRAVLKTEDVEPVASCDSRISVIVLSMLT